MAPRLVRPTTRLELRDLPGDRVVLTREQWEVAARFDGVTSAGELSVVCGLAFDDAMERIGELIAAGLCGLASESLSAGPTKQARSVRLTEPGESAQPIRRAAVPAAQAAREKMPPLPRRARGTAGPAGADGAVADPPAGVARPSADTLRRVVDGLRKLG